MIIYSTVLQTTEELTRDVFLRMILEQTGNVKLEQLISEIPETGIKKVCSESSCKVLITATDKEREITAVRIEKKESQGYTLFREYVLNEKEHILSLQSFIRNFTSELKCSEQFVQRVPKFLHRLIDGGFLATDSCFPISQNPIVINHENAYCISKIQDVQETIRLPVICIMPSIFGKYPVSIAKTAYQLSGLAHVVVMKSRKVLMELKENGLEARDCRGSVSICYPDRKRFSAIAFTAKKESRNEQLIQTVLSYTVRHLPKEIPSFDQVYDTILGEQVFHSKEDCREAKLAQKIAELKHNQLLVHLDEETQRLNEAAMEKALQEAEQIVSSYEEDIDNLKDELYEKNLFLQGLEVENQRLRNHFDQGRIPVIYFGQEREFYLGEIQDLLLSTLEDALDDIPEKSRKRDVITDILASNNYKHISKDRNEQVKNLLKGYNGMSAKIRQGLEELGFLVEETSNNHCKISYHGDNRYLVVFGNTPSDVRSGKNNAAILARMAY